MKYRLPNISKRPPNVTVLTNDEYFVSWRLLPSMTPVKHVQLLVSFEASARLGDIHMPGEHMPQQKASKVSQHTFAFTLPPVSTLDVQCLHSIMWLVKMYGQILFILPDDVHFAGFM